MQWEQALEAVHSFSFPCAVIAKTDRIGGKNVSKGTRWRIWMVRASFVPVSSTFFDSFRKNDRENNMRSFLPTGVRFHVAKIMEP